jgi:Ni/Co efflux regulator RcnB
MSQILAPQQSEQWVIMDDDFFMLGWACGMLTFYVVLKLSGVRNEQD